MTYVFVSYRRADSQHVTDRISERLLGASFSIFKDVTSTTPGDNFQQKIEVALTKSKVLIAIIGERWLGRKAKSAKPRIQQNDDYVRYELRTALERGVPIIPVLIDAAILPSCDELPKDIRDLVFKQAVRIRSDPDFDNDISRLISSIHLHTPRKGRSTAIKLGYLIGKLEIFLGLIKAAIHRNAAELVIRAELVIQKISWLAKQLGLAFNVERRQDGAPGNMELSIAQLREDIGAAFEVGYHVGRFYGLALAFFATGLVQDDNVTDDLDSAADTLPKSGLPASFLMPVISHWCRISERIKASGALSPEAVRDEEAEADRIIDQLGSQIPENK